MGLKITSPDSHFHCSTQSCLAHFLPPVGLWLELSNLPFLIPPANISQQLQEKLKERPKLCKTSQLLTLPFLAPWFLSVLPRSPSFSFSLCSYGGLKGSDLTVNTSLIVAALQPGWELSPAIFYIL